MTKPGKLRGLYKYSSRTGEANAVGNIGEAVMPPSTSGRSGRCHDISARRRFECENRIGQLHVIVDVAEIDFGYVAELIGKPQGHQVVALWIEPDLNFIATRLCVQQQLDESVGRHRIRKRRFEVTADISHPE